MTAALLAGYGAALLAQAGGGGVTPGGAHGSGIGPLTATGTNTVEQYNGSNDQTLRVYGVYDSATRGEYLQLTYTSAQAIVEAAAQGGRAQGKLLLRDNVSLLPGLRLDPGGTGGNGTVGELWLSRGNHDLPNTYGPRVQIANGGYFADSSGTVASVDHNDNVNPSTGSTFVYRGYYLHPTINYAGSPGAGSAYEALRIAASEVAVPTGPSYLIRASAGAAGTTDIWTVTNTGVVTQAAITFANLPASPTNGMLIYCSDCTFANPCASGGTGAFAKRLNGAWRCD